MKRREFISFGAAAFLLPTMALAKVSAPVEYQDEGEIAKLLSEGKTVFVDFYTDWCTTCRTQGRLIKALRQGNPDYDKNMVFVKVNWDFYSISKVAKKYKIPRRSTLLMLRGNEELGRIVAGTSKNQIRQLMDLGLSNV
jgi:thiol-disulfide isomerase/thioredoxin